MFKVLRTPGHYVLLLDVDAQMTDLACTLYKCMYAPTDILETNINMTQEEFDYVKAEIGEIIPTSEHTLTDILHFVTHVMTYYQRKQDFLKTPKVQGICARQQPLSTTSSEYVYCVYHVGFKKCMFFVCENLVMDRFFKLSCNCLFKKCMCLPMDLYPSCIRLVPDLTDATFVSLAEARLQLMGMLSREKDVQ